MKVKIIKESYFDRSQKKYVTDKPKTKAKSVIDKTRPPAELDRLKYVQARDPYEPEEFAHEKSGVREVEAVVLPRSITELWDHEGFDFYPFYENLDLWFLQRRRKQGKDDGRIVDIKAEDGSEYKGGTRAIIYFQVEAHDMSHNKKRPAGAKDWGGYGGPGWDLEYVEEGKTKMTKVKILKEGRGWSPIFYPDGKVKPIFIPVYKDMKTKEKFISPPRYERTPGAADSKKRKARQEKGQWVPPLGTSTRSFEADLHDKYHYAGGQKHSTWRLPGYKDGMSDEEVEALYAAELEKAKAQDTQIEQDREAALKPIESRLRQVTNILVRKGASRKEAQEIASLIVRQASAAIDGWAEGVRSVYNGKKFEINGNFMRLLNLVDWGEELQYPDRVHWIKNFNQETGDQSAAQYKKDKKAGFYRESKENLKVKIIK